MTSINLMKNSLMIKKLSPKICQPPYGLQSRTTLNATYEQNQAGSVMTDCEDKWVISSEFDG